MDGFTVTSPSIAQRGQVPAADMDECETLCRVDHKCKCFRYTPASKSCSLHTVCVDAIEAHVQHRIGVFRGRVVGSAHKGCFPQQQRFSLTKDVNKCSSTQATCLCTAKVKAKCENVYIASGLHGR